MARKTVYNKITDKEKLSEINQVNLELISDFLEYLKSVDRAESTIKQYNADLDIFFVWNLEHNGNKKFADITKREFMRWQLYVLNDLGWSPKRVRRVKSTLSSLSKFIENILDDEPEYENFRNVIHKIESPSNEVVREKTVFMPEELQTLLDHLVKNKEYMKAAVVALCMYSGRRKSEIPRFKVSYFDEENVIFGSLYKTPEKVKTKGRGSKGKMIYIYTLKNQFKPYLDMWLKDREEKGIESKWLFPSITNPDEPLKTTTMDSWKSGFTKFLGKDFYYHSLRHFTTSEFVRANVPTNVIQDIIGWESADMVNLYTDLSADENIGKYFDEDGIKTVEQKSLSDL